MNNNKLKDIVVNYLVEQFYRKGNRFSFNSNELRINNIYAGVNCFAKNTNRLHYFAKKSSYLTCSK